MTPPTAKESRPPIPDVVAEHFEEHGFLSLQRRKLLFSTDLPARRLGRHDERIAAHWDGLEVARPASEALARERLGADEPWERVTAVRAWLAFTRPAPADVLAVLAETPPEHAGSWREAMRGLPAELATAPWPQARLAGLPSLPLSLAIDAWAWHGDAAPARAHVRHAEPLVREAVARAVAFAAAAEDADTVLRPLLEAPEPGVRRRALWSAALLSPEAALARARALAKGAAPDPFALRVIGLLGDPADVRLLTEAAATEAGRPAVCFAFADLGTPEAIEALVRLLGVSDEALATIAGEALERAVGRIARKLPDAPPLPEEARAHVAALEPADARARIDGRPRPWSGPADDEPLAWVWRAAIARERRGLGEWRREVPDGFFSALPADAAEPGA